MKITYIILTASSILFTACGTQLKVAPINPQYGLITSENGEAKKASVIQSEKININKYKEFIFIPNGGDYAVLQTKEFKFFNEVLNYEDLQKLIIEKNLQDKVPSITDGIGLNKLSKNYKPFLTMYFKPFTIPNGITTDRYLQLVVSNPETLQDVFVAQVKLDLLWEGINDQNTRYPLFNSFFEWINENKSL